jgi:hypothetical protein
VSASVTPAAAGAPPAVKTPVPVDPTVNPPIGIGALSPAITHAS